MRKSIIRRKNAMATKSFEALVKDAMKIVRSEGLGIRIPFNFETGPIPAHQPQPAGVLFLKLLRFVGEQRPCLVLYEASEKARAERSRRSALGAILNSPGTRLVCVDDFREKDANDPAFWASIGTFTDTGDLQGFVAADMRLDDAHSILGLSGLKQLSDAMLFCDRPLSTHGLLTNEIRKAPDALFFTRYASSPTDIADREVTIRASCKDEVTSAARSLAATRLALKGKTVLIVEDEPLWSSSVSELLQGSSRTRVADVIARGTDKDIIDQLEKRLAQTDTPIALCVVDVRLRPGSGNKNTWRKVIARVRELDKGLPILVLSSSRKAEDRAKALALDADAFFPKDIGATPWEVFGEYGLERRSLKHLQALLDLVHGMVTGETAMACTWGRALRLVTTSGKDPWWKSHRFNVLREDRNTKSIVPDDWTVSVSVGQVQATIGSCIARYRRSALLASSYAHGNEPVPAEAVSSERANLITHLGALVETMHGFDRSDDEGLTSRQLLSYQANDSLRTPCGRGDHLAYHLYAMRNRASHVAGMRSCGVQEWHAFFAGMFAWLYGTDAFPALSRPKAALSIKPATQRPTAWHANENVTMAQRLERMIQPNKPLHSLYRQLLKT